MKIDLAKSEIIHFVGIGGIGMSGLALIMHGMGFKVQGSDISSNKNIERLKKKKIPGAEKMIEIRLPGTNVMSEMLLGGSDPHGHL